ncbi:MAG: FkbM family methyltransferase [Candidatus Hydrogenedentales bacterium]
MRPGKLHAFQENIELFRSLLKPGALCFDVGANIGEKSEALLEAGARVVAFEPNPLVLPELQARCQRRTNWSLVAAAVGSAASETTFYAREMHELSSLSESWEGSETVATFTVPVVTLDSSIQRFGVPFYCKLDVEGWELEVLLGLSQQIPLLSFEFHLDERGIAKTIACLKRLAQLGPSHVNVTADESSRFHLKDWVPLQEFLAWFPGDLARTLPGYLFGDIFVRSDTDLPINR